MRTLLDRFSFLVVSLAGWMNQHQQYGIHYLIEENRVLREQIGNRRMRFIKEECLEQMIFFGEDWLRSGVRNFVEYDHHEGNHQGLDNRLVIPMKRTVNTGGRIQRRQRLGGLLNYYCRGGVDILPRYRHLNWLQSTYRLLPRRFVSIHGQSDVCCDVGFAEASKPNRHCAKEPISGRDWFFTRYGGELMAPTSHRNALIDAVRYSGSLQPRLRLMINTQP